MCVLWVDSAFHQQQQIKRIHSNVCPAHEREAGADGSQESRFLLVSHTHSHKYKYKYKHGICVRVCVSDNDASRDLWQPRAVLALALMLPSFAQFI